MILRRLFRRGPDTKLNARLLEILAQRSVEARAAEDHEALARRFVWPAGSRVRAALELVDAAPLTHLLLTRVTGATAGHGGNLSLIGVHVLVDRRALGEEWGGGWAAAIRAHPTDSPGGLGAPRDFEWQPSDATIGEAVLIAARLQANERVQRRVMGVLRELSTMQFEIAAVGGVVRVAVHQTGRETPDPTAVEALLTVARSLSD